MSQPPAPSNPISFNSPRASPFRRPQSPMPASPSTVRGASLSPTKSATAIPPAMSSSPSLSPEKHNPFVRRPSQLVAASPRAASPFARPSSRLGVESSPSRALSFAKDKPSEPRELHLSTPAEPSPAPSPSPSFALSPSPSFAPSPSLSFAPSPSPSFATSPSPSAVAKSTLETPAFFDGAPSSPPFALSPSQTPSRPIATSRPAFQRTVTASTSATIRPYTPNAVLSPPSNAPRNPRLRPAMAGGNYNHIPQALLQSMRESFEVLDSTNSGTINSASLADMLNQLASDASPRALSTFFPPNAPADLNLARYLDTLSAAHSDLSHPDELSAAFAAFDVDDSGQIDLAELKDALLHTVPEPGADHLRMDEAEIDAIMNDFSARRIFGGKGLSKDLVNGNSGRGRSHVFRYRDFVASISGGPSDMPLGHTEMV